MPTTPDVFRGTPTPRRYQTKQERGYGGQWSRLSLMIRKQRPLCEHCTAAPSEEVDHIVPFSGLNDPLRFDVTNLQALCRPCHHAKTKQQRQG